MEPAQGSATTNVQLAVYPTVRIELHGGEVPMTRHATNAVTVPCNPTSTPPDPSMLSVRPDDGRQRNMATAYTKTPGRENAHATASRLMTVQSKGRLHLQTQDLGRTKSLQHLAPATEKKSSNVTTTHLTTTTAKRPFGDKTPFPNRQQQTAFATPLPGGEGKLAKLVLDPNPKLEVAPHGTTPASAPRPSATRTHVRAPRTSGRLSGAGLEPIEAPVFSLLPDHGHLNSHLQFQTPAVNGRPWDVSPMAPSPEPLLSTLDSLSAQPEEDFDEVEYMPPKPAVELWTPPEEWHLPDYGEVGREMRRRAEGWCDYDDERPVDIEVEEMKVDWAMPQLEMAELESDDPFALAPPPPPSASTKVPIRRLLATRTTGATNSRPTTASASGSSSATTNARTTTTGSASTRTAASNPYARTNATTTRARAATTSTRPAASKTASALRTGATASTPAAGGRVPGGGGGGGGRPPVRGTTATRPVPVPPGPAKWPPAVTTRAPTAGEIAARAAADVTAPAPAAAAARTTRVGAGTRPRAATTRAPVAPSAFRMGAGALRTGPGASTPVAGAGGGGRRSVAATTRAPSVLRTSRPPTAVGGRRVVAAGIDPIDVELGADGEGPTGEEEFLFDV